jgi:hypothetical protein
LDANERTQGGDGIALATNLIGHVLWTHEGGVFRSVDKAETWTGSTMG